MIKGLTHDEGGNLHKITKYRGKISTGYAPGEGPNKSGNAPVAAGFFRMLKEQVINERVGSKVIPRKVWNINEPVQKAIEEAMPRPNKTPRRVEIVSLFKSPIDMWESSLAMYSSGEGLLCKSQGYGTNARYLKFGPNGERDWIDREFEGKSGCLFRECPDFKGGKCKPIGLLKCFPTADMAADPYRFETRSINTIMGIESSIQHLSTLLNAAHAVKEMEAKKELPYDGFFGAKMYLVHKKIKSGGRDVFITDLVATDELIQSIMEPIKRGLAKKAKNSVLIGASGSISMLEQAGQKLLASEEIEATDIDGPVIMDIEDQKEIAVQFGADADADTGDSAEVVETESFDSSEDVGDKGKAATEALLNEGNDSPKKDD